MKGTIECPVLTIKELAAYLGCGMGSIYRWLKDPAFDIPRFKLGTDWRFNKEDVDEWRLTKSKEKRKAKCDE